MNESPYVLYSYMGNQLQNSNASKVVGEVGDKILFYARKNLSEVRSFKYHLSWQDLSKSYLLQKNVKNEIDAKKVW